MNHVNQNCSVCPFEHLLSVSYGKIFCHQICDHQSNSLRCTTPSLVSLLSGNSGQMSDWHFGIELDGVGNYSDLGTVQVVEDPKMENVGGYDLQFPFETTIDLAVSDKCCEASQNQY